jgi:rare lipoprotein A
MILAVGLLVYGCGSTPQPAPSKPAATPTPSTSKAKPKPYKALGQWYTPLENARGFKQRGLASWYGKEFHGKPTASGEIYDMYAVSAAHKTLPLGTYVRVHNKKNDRTLELRINDRGPFVKGRIIDLSYTAAKKLGVVGPGTAPVEIIALGAKDIDQPGSDYIPIDYYSGNFTFQVGAFKNRQNADRLLGKLDPIYKNAHITTYTNARGTFYRVRVGRCTTLAQADKYEDYLVNNGFPDAFTIAE